MSDKGEENKCISREQVMLYVDGALSSSGEAAVETHCASCADCLQMLNIEKALFGAIERSMVDDGMPEVPEGFVKAVTVAAESDVRGLRNGRNRMTALFVICALGTGVAMLVAFGYSAGFKAPKRIVSVAFRILAFLFHSAYDLVAGLSGVLRSVCVNFVSGSYFSIFLLLSVFLLSIAIFSRLVLRQGRA